MSASKTVNVMGDILSVTRSGGVWVSPCNGAQHGTADQAMRAELVRYYQECGDDPDDPATAREIEGYLSQMTDAD